MNDMIKEWLKNLYTEEIKIEKGTIENERLWANGSDGDEVDMHNSNIELHEEYIKVLEDLIDKL